MWSTVHILHRISGYEFECFQLKPLYQFRDLGPIIWASLVAQRLKFLPAVWETWVRSLGWEDPLEKEMATHSSTVAWRIPWMEKPGGLQSTGLQRVEHDWVTSLTLNLISVSRSLFSSIFVCFFRFQIWVKKYSICFSIFDLYFT